MGTNLIIAHYRHDDAQWSSSHTMTTVTKSLKGPHALRSRSRARSHHELCPSKTTIDRHLRLDVVMMVERHPRVRCRLSPRRSTRYQTARLGTNVTAAGLCALLAGGVQPAGR